MHNERPDPVPRALTFGLHATSALVKDRFQLGLPVAYLLLSGGHDLSRTVASNSLASL
jgi:hypothetical protein